MKKTSSLAMRIVISFLVLITLSAGIVGWFANTKSEEALTKMAEEVLQQESHGIVNEITTRMENIENIVHITSELPPIVAYSNEAAQNQVTAATTQEAMEILKQFRESEEAITEVIFIADPAGNVVVDSDNGGYQGINVGDRAYFKASMKGETYWDDVLLSKGSGLPVSVHSIPLLDDEGNITGIVAAAIKFDAITAPLNGVKVGETGYAYMLKQDGTVLYHPEEERILNENMLTISQEASNPEMEAVVQAMMNMEEGSGEYDFQGVHKLNMYHPIANWSIAVNVPTAEYKAAVYETRNALIWITIISILIGGVVAVVISKRITDSVKRLMKLMATAENGDLSIVAEVKGNDEIAQLGRSFNAMMDGLKEQASAVEKLSQGDLNIDLKLKSDKDVLGKALQTMLETLTEMREEIDTLIQATQRGELSIRAEADRFAGAWKELIYGVNHIVDAYSKPINVTNEYVTAIGMGNIPDKITETYYGDFNQIKNSLNNCIDAMNDLLNDTQGLITNAVEGQLDARADASRHQGDYKAIVDGINGILDAVVEPIKEASDVLMAFSNGDLNAKVIGQYQGDHAVIKNALNGTIQTIASYIDEIRGVLTHMAEGDMNQQIERNYLGDFVEIKNSINMILGAFNEVLYEINQASEQVSSGAYQVSQSSESLSQGATEQASAIEQISASISDIAGKTKNAAMKAQDINSLSVRVRGDAEKGDNEMKAMLQAMSEIEDSSISISQIIKVIDEIAFQTNLLALNAAVEAARAGQHGKGFAVVAEEVRNLAARSAKAASETTDLIEASISRVKQGTEIANQTAGDLQKIVGGIGEVVGIISEIATEANDQAMAVAEVNEGVNQVSTVTQMNTATAQQSAAASEEMSSQATLLQEMVGRFQLKGQI